MALKGTVPLGTWRPNGPMPLVLALRTGMGVAVWIAVGTLIAGSWALVYSILLISGLVDGPEGAPDGVGVPVMVTIAGLLLVVPAVWVLLIAYHARRATVEVGPRGIALLPGSAVIFWEELAQVGVDVEVVEIRRDPSPLRPFATRTKMQVVITLLPHPGAFTSRDLPDLTGIQPPEPYTHCVVVPQPVLGADGRNLPVVRDLDAALRYFAPGIYAGVVERFSRVGFW